MYTIDIAGGMAAHPGKQQKEQIIMQMNASSIVNQKAEWEKLGVKLPAFDHAAMTAATKEHPIWVHFGAGNIFRGFIAALQ